MPNDVMAQALNGSPGEAVLTCVLSREVNGTQLFLRGLILDAGARRSGRFRNVGRGLLRAGPEETPTGCALFLADGPNRNKWPARGLYRPRDWQRALAGPSEKIWTQRGMDVTRRA